MIAYIILFTLLGSLASLIGVIVLVKKHDLAQKISLTFVSFAAGTLLAVALLDLLPEALHHNEELGNIFDVPLIMLVGIIIFFTLERFLLWYHHHHEQEGDTHPSTTLVLVGDAVHNFVDGIVIASSFFASIPLGIVTALAVVLHEIPQEIGDMAVLLHGGMKAKKAVFFNFLTALTAIFGAMLAISFQENISSALPLFLSLTAGFFIYISVADLIPQLHRQRFEEKGARFQTPVFFAGILIVYLLGRLLGH